MKTVLEKEAKKLRLNDVRVNKLYKYRERRGTTEPFGSSAKVLGDGLERTVLDKA